LIILKGLFTRPSSKISEVVGHEFDREYYARAYPDVAQAGVDPLRHYVTYGWREGRKPREDFNPQFYLWLYPDVAKAKLNPFYHYVKSGRAEGRIAVPERLVDAQQRRAWQFFASASASAGAPAEKNRPKKPCTFVVKYERDAKPSKICFEDTGAIDSALMTIEAQVPHFDHDLASLDTNSSSPHVKEVDRTKERQQFEFTVEAISTRQAGPHFPKWADSRLRMPKASKLDQDIMSWCRQHLSPDSKAVVVAARPGDRVLSAFSALGLCLSNQVRLFGGEGDIVPTKIFHPDRYRPGSTSFAQWLAVTGETERASFSAFVLGEEATEFDIEVLSGLLTPGQHVVVSVLSGVREAIYKDWSGVIQETSDSVLICSPGIKELDPTFLDAADAAQINWPKISVVTVSYNQGKFLKACLDSVLNQDYPNLEYIVVDACSKDDSIAILESYRHRLTKLIIEPDNGQSEGINKGFALTSGDILTWVNSDDMLAPGTLRRAARAFMIYNCDLVAGACERIGELDDEVKFLHHSAVPFGRRLPLDAVSQLRWYDSWDQGDYFFQPEVLFSADIWRRAGGGLKQHLYWGMDWELWIRMALAGATIVHIPPRFGRSREHPLQKTTSDRLYLFQLKNILLEHHDVLHATKNKLMR
jgi:hypothetical protein